MNATEARPMLNCRLRKELQVIGPFWLLLALAGPVSSHFIQNREPGQLDLFLVPWVLICAILGSLSFGHEFSHHTMASLLAQPISRARIWREKHVAAAVILGSVSIWMWGWNFEIGVKGWFFVFAAVIAFMTGPTLTLLSRNALAGPVFTMAVPFILFLIVEETVAHFYALHLAKLAALPFDPRYKAAIEAPWAEWQVQILVCSIVGVVYVSAMHWLGRRYFNRMQIAGGGEAIGLPEFAWGSKAGAVGAHVPARPQGMYWSLVMKELRLQQFSFLLTGVFLVMVGVCFFLKLRRPSMEEILFLIPLFLFVPLIAVIPGSMAVAEERQMGTLQAQLIAPISRTKQWLIKVLVAVGLTYLLGLVIPFGVYYLIDGWVNPFGEHVRFDDEQRVGMILAVIYGAGSVVSLYASSFAATPLRAILASFGIVVGGWALGAVVLEVGILQDTQWKMLLQDWTIQAYQDPNSMLRGLNRTFEAYGIQGGLAMTYVGVTLVTLLAIVLFAKLLALGYANFRRAGVAKSALKLQLGVIALYVVLSVFSLGVLALVFDTGLIQWSNQQNNQMRMNQRQRQVPSEFR